MDSKSAQSSLLSISRDIIEHVHPFLKQHVYKFLKGYSQARNSKKISRSEFLVQIKQEYRKNIAFQNAIKSYIN